MGRRQRRKKSKKGLYIIIFILFVVISMFLAYVVYNNFFDKENKNVVITIPSGATTSDIAKILKENGIILSELVFKLKSKANGYDSKYKQGVYNMNTSDNLQDIMELLVEGGNSNEKKITIPEGYTVFEIAQYLEQNGIVSANDFINISNNTEFNYKFLNDIPNDRKYRLEGYLFPDTYYITDDATSEQIINKMLSRFNDVYTDENIEKAKNLGFTFDEIINIASIIEEEIAKPEEKPVASGVIYNRLKMNMPLQIDSTVLYDIGKKEVVAYVDLEVDSPYNTYKNKGLPRGPISNPGEESIKSALNPDDNDYIYYVLKDRTSKEHYYTNDYDDFLSAKQRYKEHFDN